MICRKVLRILRLDTSLHNCRGLGLNKRWIGHEQTLIIPMPKQELKHTFSKLKFSQSKSSNNNNHRRLGYRRPNMGLSQACLLLLTWPQYGRHQDQLRFAKSFLNRAESTQAPSNGRKVSTHPWSSCNAHQLNVKKSMFGGQNQTKKCNVPHDDHRIMSASNMALSHTT